MESTTLEISNLPESIVQALRKRAEDVGTTAPEYVRYLIEEDLASAVSLRTLYAPVREQIKASGVTDEQLETEIDDAITEVRASRQMFSQFPV